MSLFITYVLLGFSIALPVGPITVEMTKQGLKNGFMHGWLVGLGGMTIDIALILALYAGLASVLSYPIVQLVMWLMGGLFLLYIGYESIKNANHGISLGSEKTKKSKFSSYLGGLLVAVSPGNLIFWITVFGTVLTSSFQQSSINHFILIASGILIGILIHDLGLMLIVSTGRRLMSQPVIKWSSIVAGCILIGFSLRFFYQFFNLIFI